MRAMVLCAGLGTRLRPFTERWPKPAMPLLGQPILRYALGTLKEGGVREVGINTHHLPEEMEAVARRETSALGLGFTAVHEPVIQGTGGGIRGLRRFLEGDVFVVFNGDILFTVELEPIVADHRASGAAATLVLLPMPRNEKFAAVEVDEEGRVRRIAGRGPSTSAPLTSWHFSGVHVMSPEVFDFMSPSGPEDINRDVYLRMIAQGRIVRGAVAQGYWSDLGTPSRYLATTRDLLFGQVGLAAFGEGSPLRSVARGTGNWWQASDAEIHGGVAGPAFFGPGVRVEKGAKIGSAVSLGAGSKVLGGARLNRVAVLENTEIRADEELVELIAWREHRVPAGLAEGG